MNIMKWCRHIKGGVMKDLKFFNLKTAVEGAGNDNSKPPENLMGKLLYFKDIPENSKCAVLNGKLMFAHSQISEMEDFVLGFILNNAAEEKFGEIMKDMEHSVSPKTRFLSVWNAAADAPFGFYNDNSAMSFLWPKKLMIPDQLPFGDFALFEARTAEAAANIAKWLLEQKKSPFMILHGETMIDWKDLRDLLIKGNCHVAEVPQEIIFDTSGEMRARRAFPHLFPQNLNGPKPQL